jgi:phosphatidylglycerophosphate synthase
MNKENIWNIPNFLTSLRILIAFLTVFLIFAGFNIFYIIIAFMIGMLTDFFDGQIARRFKLKTEFGRKFDMIADRILIISVGLASIIKLATLENSLNNQILQIFLILSREIIGSQVILAALISNRKIPIPQVRVIGKATTFMQAITFPIILLSIPYELFNFSLCLAIITSVIGATSAFYYINDVKILTKNENLN